MFEKESFTLKLQDIADVYQISIRAVQAQKRPAIAAYRSCTAATAISETAPLAFWSVF